MIDPNAPIYTLTVAQFLSLLNERPAPAPESGKHYVYSIQALGQALGCGLSKTYKLRRSGIFDPAIRQNGRKLIIDVDMARELFGKENEEGGKQE